MRAPTAAAAVARFPVPARRCYCWRCRAAARSSTAAHVFLFVMSIATMPLPRGKPRILRYFRLGNFLP